MKHIKHAAYADILRDLEVLDVPHDPARQCKLDDLDVFRKHFDDYFRERERQESVLGIDIYRYSHMPAERQRLVPTLFTFLRDKALTQCKETEGFLFEDFRDCFVSTGDGGFEVFATPLHAVVYAIYFETWLAAFNSWFHFPKLRALFGDDPITVRYTLTHDVVFHQDRNLFGRGIINNARIIGRDSLNRFLIDQGAVRWFQQRLASVESLLTLRGEDLRTVVGRTDDSGGPVHSALFAPKANDVGVRSVHLQKLGIVSTKSTNIDIFSLLIQVVVPRSKGIGAGRRTAVISIGNLNPTGLTL